MAYIYLQINMWASIIGAGINVVANALGTAIANKRKAEAREKLDNEYEQQLSELNTEIGSNYLDRADSRAVLRAVTDSNTEAMRQLNTDAIRGGATDEAKVAMASQLNKRTADVTGQLAALGAQHKDRLKAQKRALSAERAKWHYSLDSDTSGIENILSSIGGAAQNLGNAYASKGTTNSDEIANFQQKMRQAQSEMKPLEIPQLDGMGQLNYGR